MGLNLPVISDFKAIPDYIDKSQADSLSGNVSFIVSKDKAGEFGLPTTGSGIFYNGLQIAQKNMRGYQLFFDGNVGKMYRRYQTYYGSWSPVSEVPTDASSLSPEKKEYVYEEYREGVKLIFARIGEVKYITFLWHSIDDIQDVGFVDNTTEGNLMSFLNENMKSDNFERFSPGCMYSFPIFFKTDNTTPKEGYIKLQFVNGEMTDYVHVSASMKNIGVNDMCVTVSYI